MNTATRLILAASFAIVLAAEIPNHNTSSTCYSQSPSGEIYQFPCGDTETSRGDGGGGGGSLGGGNGGGGGSGSEPGGVE